MSLSSSNNSITYKPEVATTEFEFSYPYFATTDIQVTHENSLGSITSLVYGIDYTLSATNGDVASGCTVTTTSSYTSGDTITVFREVPNTQEYDLQNGATIDPTALNKALDRTVAQNQQQQSSIDRCFIHPITDEAGTTYEAPSIANRASKVLGWDANGNINAQSLVESGTVTVDTTRGLEITGNQIYAKVDDVTVEFESVGDKIAVKALGIDTAQLADDAVTRAKIADAAMSGDDATLITGTAGTSGDVATWNGDGDLVGTYNVETTLTDDDTAMPTSGAIVDYTASFSMKYSGATVFTGSMPTTWTDLDLSGTIGANRCYVHLAIIPDASVDGLGIRENGSAKDFNFGSPQTRAGWGASGGGAASGYTVELTTITDVAGIIEWKSLGAGSGGTTIELLCYQQLQ